MFFSGLVPEYAKKNEIVSAFYKAWLDNRDAVEPVFYYILKSRAVNRNKSGQNTGRQNISQTTDRTSAGHRPESLPA